MMTNYPLRLFNYIKTINTSVSFIFVDRQKTFRYMWPQYSEFQGFETIINLDLRAGESSFFNNLIVLTFYLQKKKFSYCWTHGIWLSSSSDEFPSSDCSLLTNDLNTDNGIDLLDELSVSTFSLFLSKILSKSDGSCGLLFVGIYNFISFSIPELASTQSKGWDCIQLTTCSSPNQLFYF